MKDLMFEMCSPNITGLIPFKFQEFDQLDTSNFIVTPHGNGIFEFTYNHPHWGKPIKVGVENIFNAHSDHIYNVNVTGLKTYRENPAVGSTRFCTMHYDFAAFLTKIIKHRCVVDVISEDNQPYIRSSDRNWYEMLNVSQYFRFMKYLAGGEHFPHYDSDFHYEYNGAITKYSLVVYFTECQTGELAFVKDTRGETTDWDRQAKDDEIYLKILPAPLKIVVFPHMLCHTVLPYTDKGNERIICRGDILYKRVG